MFSLGPVLVCPPFWELLQGALVKYTTESLLQMGFFRCSFSHALCAQQSTGLVDGDGQTNPKP